jgi:AraC-like DNA-binding protein
MATRTALNTATKAMLEVCARRGVGTVDLLKTANIDPASFDQFNARIPADKKNRIWDEAHKRTGNEHLGLCAAEIVPFGGYGVLDFLLFASSTLDEALKRTARFYRILNDRAELRLEKHKNVVLAELCKPDSSASPHMLGLSAEFSFAMMLLRFGSVSGKALKPEKVYFTHLPPHDTSHHRKLFRAPMLFGQDVNRLVFNKDFLNAPLPQSDPELAETLELHAGRILKRLPAENDIAMQVSDVLRARLCGGDVSLKATAKALAMSERNLQRTLCGQAVTYRELLDKLRYELALDYIAQQVEASEITRRLGFSETSTFYRAFQRWTKTYARDS